MNINATLLGQVIVFAILIWFTVRFVWPPLMQAIEDRAAKIAEGLAAAERGKQDLQLAEKRAGEVLGEAKRQATEMLGETEKRVNQLLEEARVNAKTEGERLIASAKTSIDQEVMHARRALRVQVSELAIDAAEKILSREIDTKAHADLLKAFEAKL